jgi:serine/threonine protein kinase
MRGIALEPEAINLLTSMLAMEPADRPTIAEVLEHPWLKLPMTTKEEL